MKLLAVHFTAAILHPFEVVDDKSAKHRDVTHPWAASYVATERGDATHGGDSARRYLGIGVAERGRNRAVMRQGTVGL